MLTDLESAREALREAIYKAVLDETDVQMDAVVYVARCLEKALETSRHST